MVKRQWMNRLVIAVCGPALMTACVSFGDDRQADPAQDPGTASDATEVRIPDTTRVLAADARAALISYDKDSGKLVFSRSSAGAIATAAHQISDPAGLRIGDVVVSEPAPQAPYGVLRRVTEVSRSADTVEVTTAPAMISDAVEQASVDMKVPITGGKVVTLVPGATLEMPPAEDHGTDRIGVGYTANVQWSLPAGYDFNTNGDCRLVEASVVSMNAVAQLGLEISGFNVTKFGVWGTAGASAKVNIACKSSVTDRNVTVAAWISPVYLTYIGGVVPMVFQFSLAAVAGVRSGIFDLMFLKAEWSQNYEAGLGYNAGSGWGPWTSHTSTNPTFWANGSGSVRVKFGPVFALSLFAGDIFNVYSWAGVGFRVGATGAIYALPFLEVSGMADIFDGHTSGTLYGGMESGGAAGAFIDLSVSILGWPVFGLNRAWSVGSIFPEIKHAITTFAF